ncbi:MAG TPA: NADH:ubiquinone oxidoreductase [Spirochaetota bacterium]|nr:NADH:ubiquinone oxidoreductase [Spirochaetota bacterium]
MFRTLSVFFHNGRQFIPSIRSAELREPFRGRPVITTIRIDEKKAAALCPVKAIGTAPLSIDMGRCLFCGECARAFPEKIIFTADHKISANKREDLVIHAGNDLPVHVDRYAVRKEIRSVCGRSMKLRQVSAAGDNSTEWELGASGNVQFDMGRFGIEFVASPRHADGIVITGPVSVNMARALQICHDSTPSPQIIILAGTDAISGGIWNGSSAIDRSFIDRHKVDLYIPGNPPHPLTIINGILDLMTWD